MMTHLPPAVEAALAAISGVECARVVSSEELVLRMARGDRSALAELYDRFSPAMFGVALRMLHERSAAEDLVHDVFVEAFRKASGFERKRGTVKTWLMVRLHSRAVDRLRARGRRRMISMDDEDVPEIPASTESPDIRADAWTVRNRMAELSIDQRRVIELAYFNGLTRSEIASELGIPIGTVKSRLASGLAMLRALVTPVGEPS